MLKLVPFNSEWVAHETLDLHAIYRRPVRDFHGDIKRDAHGFLQWDLTTGLPLRSHAKWAAKGFEYVTLATSEDVMNAADPERAVDGVTPLQFPAEYLNQNKRNRGPWDAGQYLADQAEQEASRREKLLERIERLGPDAAEEFEQQRDPGYRLPGALRVSSQPASETPKRRGRPRKEPQPDEVAA